MRQRARPPPAWRSSTSPMVCHTSASPGALAFLRWRLCAQFSSRHSACLRHCCSHCSGQPHVVYKPLPVRDHVRVFGGASGWCVIRAHPRRAGCAHVCPGVPLQTWSGNSFMSDLLMTSRGIRRVTHPLPTSTYRYPKVMYHEPKPHSGWCRSWNPSSLGPSQLG